MQGGQPVRGRRSRKRGELWQGRNGQASWKKRGEGREEEVKRKRVEERRVGPTESCGTHDTAWHTVMHASPPPCPPLAPSYSSVRFFQLANDPLPLHASPPLSPSPPLSGGAAPYFARFDVAALSRKLQRFACGEREHVQLVHVTVVELHHTFQALLAPDRADLNGQSAQKRACTRFGGGPSSEGCPLSPETYTRAALSALFPTGW